MEDVSGKKKLPEPSQASFSLMISLVFSSQPIIPPVDLHLVYYHFFSVFLSTKTITCYKLFWEKLALENYGSLLSF